MLQMNAASFREEEWAGFQETEDAPVLYCKVIQRGMDSNNKSYVVSLGDDMKVALLNQLFKFDE